MIALSFVTCPASGVAWAFERDPDLPGISPRFVLVQPWTQPEPYVSFGPRSDGITVRLGANALRCRREYRDRVFSGHPMQLRARLSCGREFVLPQAMWLGGVHGGTARDVACAYFVTWRLGPVSPADYEVLRDALVRVRPQR